LGFPSVYLHGVFHPEARDAVVQSATTGVGRCRRGARRGALELRLRPPAPAERAEAAEPARRSPRNELPAVDRPNEATVARLFAHGGLSHARRDGDGVFRDEIRVPKHQYIWQPAIIVMERGGELELDIANEDEAFHIAFLPSNDNRRVVELPVHERGKARVRLDQPGLYWFGCPVSNHAGRGMLGLVIVKGEVPPEARLDRPPMPRPRSD
jgi:PQQ system protein